MSDRKYWCICRNLIYIDAVFEGSYCSYKDIQEANFKTSSSRLLAAVMSALCHTSVKLTSIFPIAYDGEVLLRSIVKQVSTENDSTLVHRFPLLVGHMEKLSQVRVFRNL